MRKWNVSLLCSWLLLVSALTSAQVSVNSAILGVIKDKSGAAVPGVAVVITDAATNAKRTITSSEDGLYVVENLKPGLYGVMASRNGFKVKNITNVVLQVSQRVRVDIEMEVGSVSETVDVTGAPPVIETGTSSVGQVITDKSIVDLPLNGRQFLQLATLSAGVQKVTNSAHDTTGGAVSVNGMSFYSNNTIVDGIMNQETGAGRMTFSPSVDMIQEFKIQTNTYDAEYGRSGGGQIEVVTRRGSNNYHGSAYEFLRNSALDARPLFQKGELPPFRRNQFGATLGGRIPYTSKDYFFLSYEGLRSSQGLTAVLSLPPGELRDGDFSSVSTPIYDPLTLDSGTGQRQQFPGNIIPADRISSVAKYYLDKFLPIPPSGSGPSRNYVSNPNQVQNIDQISFRYDRDFSASDSVTFRYTRNQLKGLLPRGDSGVATPLTGLGEDINLYGQNHKIGWTHLFGPKTMNSLNIGFSQYFQDRYSVTRGKGDIAASGIQGITAGLNTGIPTFQISGFDGIADNRIGPIWQPFNNLMASDTFSKIVGRHSLRFGGGFLYSRTESNLHLLDRGVLNFTPRFSTSAVSAVGDQYNALAEFLLGYPSSTQIFQNPLVADWRSYTSSAFFQDTWTVTPNLTLNLGIRYDVYVVPYDAQDRFVAFDVASQKNVYAGSVPDLPGVPAGSVTADSLGYPRNLQFPTQYNNWGPRVGFAWTPWGNKNTVLRGGYGRFYNWIVIDTATTLALGPPWVPQTAISCNPDVPCVSLASNPFSTSIVPSLSSNVASKSNRTPYANQYSLGIQHALSPTMSLDVSFVGNDSGDNLVRWNINQPEPGPGAYAPRRPYPTLGSLTALETIGVANYNSLQTTFRKNYDSKGLIFLASYTWSHALGDSVSGPQIFEGQPVRDFRNLAAEYGNTIYDLRHLLSLNWIYQLPFGKGKAFGGSWGGVTNALMGGWSVDGIVYMRTGQYLTPSDIFDNSNAGGSRPDVIGDPNGRKHAGKSDAIAQWFNTSAFERAPQYTFGNSGVGIIEGPGFVNFDLALHKRFPIKETAGLEFRAELFNAFNHGNLGNPQTAFGTASFGTIASASGPARSIQFGLRFTF